MFWFLSRSNRQMLPYMRAAKVMLAHLSQPLTSYPRNINPRSQTSTAAQILSQTQSVYFRRKPPMSRGWILPSSAQQVASYKMRV